MPGLELLTRCQQGERGAWEELLRELYPQALAMAAGIVRDKELANDVVQNALLKVLQHIEKVRDLEAFAAWLHRVVTNEAYLALRVYQRETAAEFLASLGRGEHDPEERAVFRHEFLRAMRRMPPEFQEAVVLCDLLGHKIQEAAQERNIPVGTLKSRLFRGRESLQKLLADFHKGKGEPQVERSREEIIYDYLEGRLDAAEQGKLEAELAASPELNKKVGEQRDFLRLLHSMTGKISLSAGQVAEKMAEVYDALQDYSQTIEETFISDNRAQTLAVRTWFKKPNWQKVEAEHPQLGKMVNITKDNELLSYQDKLPKAVRSKVSEDFLNAAGQDFRLTLREITTNHTTVLLGSESIEGRNCYHLKLTQAAPGDAGKVTTHIWIDKATWMPLLTEQYNSKGDLTQRKAVRNLSINTGLPDSLFELPAGIEIEELCNQEITAPREVSLEEAQREMPFAPFLLTDQSLILHKCQIVMV
ncbi:MAG TPA: sigma-70 family RNA polymerase sigma factor, partial [Verrucomicrobiae bacterium]|nr:sigma-70 family RNA polymerase sigma factor [Verrucomicrobiae bacterium]